jgi:hypothetical protein
MKLVIKMLDQDFKPITIEMIQTNLEYIKQFASHITSVDIDTELDQLVKIIKSNSKSKIKLDLNKLIAECSTDLDKMIHEKLN